MAEQINATDRRISTHRFVFNTGIRIGGGGGGGGGPTKGFVILFQL